MTYPQQSDFYEFYFPHSTKYTSKDFQYAFTNYGCMEDVNLKFNVVTGKFLFDATKQKLLAVNKDATDVDKIFFPSHPALPLGKPETISKLIIFPDEKDLYNKRLPSCGDGSNNKVKEYTYVERHIANFAIDHPDAAQGTFIRLLSHYFPFKMSNQNARKRILPVQEKRLDCGFLPYKFMPYLHCGNNTVAFPNHVSPYMFDIPYQLLNKLLLEELETEVSKLSYDSSYTGGVLNYKHIDNKKHFSFGFLFRPGGKDMSDLSMQLLCVDKRHESDCSGEFFPKIQLGSDYRFSLNGRILQIDSQCSSEDPSRFNVGTRTMHHAMLSMVDGRKTILKLDDDDKFKLLSFSSPKCAKHVSVFRSPRVLNSIAVSPHIDGECLVALDDGKVLLWNARLHSSVSTEQKADDHGFDVIWSSKAKSSTWSQVGFGSHPRQVFVANKSQVSLIDVRGRKTSEIILTKSPHEDEVMTMLSGSSFTPANEFQCAVATSQVVELYDTRHYKVPLLEWAVNLRTPCQHLAVVGSTQEGAAFNLNSILLAASHRFQEMHMYQYNTKSRPADILFRGDSKQHRMQPPTSTAPPYSCETFKDFRRALTRRLFRSHGHIDRRLCYPIVGVTGFGYRTTEGEDRVVVLQANGYGDVMYQPFGLRDPEVLWSEENITSGLGTAAKSKVKEQQEKADEIRFAWASTVDCNYREEVEEKSMMELRCARTELNAIELDQRSLVSKLLRENRRRPAGDCVVCRTVCGCQANSLSDDDDAATEPSCFDKAPYDLDDATCSGCGSVKDRASALFECRKQGTFHPSNLKGDQDPVDAYFSESSFVKVKKPRVEPLTLVNPAPLKRGLGGVLCSTWDGSYEDYWESMRKDFEKANKLRAKEKRESLLDASQSNNKSESAAEIFRFGEALNSETRPQLHVDEKLSSDMADLFSTESKDKKTIFNKILEADFSEFHTESDGNLSCLETSAKLPKLSSSVLDSILDPEAAPDASSPLLFEDENSQSEIRSALTRAKSATESMVREGEVESSEPLSILSINKTPSSAQKPNKIKSLKRKRQIGFF